MRPNPAVDATLVVDTPIAVYSGMAPGLVAGQYERHELEIDALPLARRAGVRVVMSPCIGVEAATRRLLVDGREPLPFDLASFDVGSTVAALDLPGVREHAVPTRPINRLAATVDGRLDALTNPEPRIVVVGSGAGGIELAFCIDARLRSRGLEPGTTIVEAGSGILPGYHPTLARRIAAAARARGVETMFGARVAAVEADAVRLEGGGRIDADLTFWVTGAAAPTLFRNSDLPLDDCGFVRTRSTLQVERHDHVFAVGDCATLTNHPGRARAGVYAVRMGPYLIDNLERRLDGRPLRPYTPQGDFLSLLNLGDGTAVGAKWGRAFEGRWVMRLKDRIDRRFMERFQALDPAGAPRSWFADMMPKESGGGGAGPTDDAGPSQHAGGTETTAMFCGGCAAKVGPDRLGRALARVGLDAKTGQSADVILDLATPDDAVAYRTPAGDRVVASLDAFPAFTDDPWLVGRVAAVNACSDLHATGVAPRFAQALVTLPRSADGGTAEELLFQVLAGARAALDDEDVLLLGGHTNTGPELVVGFHVEGVAGNGRGLLLKGAVQPGDDLVLTKPLGCGVLLAADRMGLCPGRSVRAALASMQTSNRGALEAALRAGTRAATDVSGFGLAGHLGEMAQASGLDIEVDVDALPALPGALQLLERGGRSTSHHQNTRLPLPVKRQAAPGPRLELAFDPQTAGGLVLAAAPDRTGSLVDDLRARGLAAARVVAHARPLRSGRPQLILG